MCNWKRWKFASAHFTHCVVCVLAYTNIWEIIKQTHIWYQKPSFRLHKNEKKRLTREISSTRTQLPFSMYAWTAGSNKQSVCMRGLLYWRNKQFLTFVNLSTPGYSVMELLLVFIKSLAYLLPPNDTKVSIWEKKIMNRWKKKKACTNITSTESVHRKGHNILRAPWHSLQTGGLNLLDFSLWSHKRHQMV